MAPQMFGFEHLKEKSFWSGVLAEFLATYLFLFIGVSAANTADSFLYIAFAFGISIAVLACTFGPFSGGHINNAVSFGLFLAQRCSLVHCLFFTLAQVIGAALGTGTVYLLSFDDERLKYGLLAVSPKITVFQGLMYEIILTALLVFVILSVTDGTRNPMGSNINVPLTIGLAVFLAHLTSLRYTGCGINPARAFGSALINGDFTNHWIYWIGPYLGALLAALIWHVINMLNVTTVEVANKDSGLDDETPA